MTLANLPSGPTTEGVTESKGASQVAGIRRHRLIGLAYLYILPAALIMLLITFWPLLYQFWMSLTNYSNLNIRTQNIFLQVWGSLTGNTRPWNSPAFVGLGNYRRILGTGLSQVLSGFDFWRILLFDLIWTFVNLFFSVSIGVAVALLLNQQGLWLKRFYRAVYILPWALPGLVSAMIWNNVFERESGLLNQFLRVIGLPHDIGWLTQVNALLPYIPPYVRVPSGVNPYAALLVLIVLLIVPYFVRWVRRHWLVFTLGWVIGWELFFVFALVPLSNMLGLSDAPGNSPVPLIGLGSVLPLSFYAALITNVWLGWPFMMVISTGALQSIPRELYEAAKVDGATGWQTFWSMTVPLLRPAMVPAIIISMTWTFNQFNVLYFTTGGGPLHATEILVTEAYRLVNQTTISLPGVGSVQPFGIAAAFAYIVFAVLGTITLITNRISRATESYAD